MAESPGTLEYGPEAYAAAPDVVESHVTTAPYPYNLDSRPHDPLGYEEEHPVGPITLRNPHDAVAWALRQATGYSGYCLVFTRTAYDVPQYYGSASRAWYGSAHRHLVAHGAQVPRGVPVFWTGGSRGYGHITISLGGGMCRTTDWPYRNQISSVAIDRITAAWGLNLVGWTEDLNRVRVWTPPPSSATDGVVSLAKLRPGKANLDVREMQRRLAKKGAAHFTPTGYFGSKTREAVRSWQNRCGFRGSDADGLPGRISMRMLGFEVHS